MEIIDDLRQIRLDSMQACLWRFRLALYASLAKQLLLGRAERAVALLPVGGLVHAGDFDGGDLVLWAVGRPV